MNKSSKYVTNNPLFWFFCFCIVASLVLSPFVFLFGANEDISMLGKSTAAVTYENTAIYFDDCVDEDGDGWCELDCDNSDPNINPAIIEVCDNGIDDDCDGYVDAADGECNGCYKSVPEENQTPNGCWDGIDNDCDGMLDNDPECCGDFDGDGYDSWVCNGGRDCFDGSSETHPWVFETEAAGKCNDGIDNDCDNLVDYEDPECFAGCMKQNDREYYCNDGEDNDCDNMWDCDDWDCDYTSECGGGSGGDEFMMIFLLIMHDFVNEQNMSKQNRISALIDDAAPTTGAKYNTGWLNKIEDAIVKFECEDPGLGNARESEIRTSDSIFSTIMTFEDDVMVLTSNPNLDNFSNQMFGGFGNLHFIGPPEEGEEFPFSIIDGDVETLVKFPIEIPKGARITEAHIEFFAIMIPETSDLNPAPEPFNFLFTDDGKDFTAKVKLLQRDGKWEKRGFGSEDYPLQSNLMGIAKKESEVFFNLKDMGWKLGYNPTADLSQLVQEYIDSGFYRQGDSIGFAIAPHEAGDQNFVIIGNSGYIGDDIEKDESSNPMDEIGNRLLSSLMGRLIAPKLVVKFEYPETTVETIQMMGGEDNTFTTSLDGNNFVEMFPPIRGFGNITIDDVNEFIGGTADYYARWQIDLPAYTSIHSAYVILDGIRIEDESNEIGFNEDFDSEIQLLQQDGKWDKTGFGLKNYSGFSELSAIGIMQNKVTYNPYSEGWGWGMHRTADITPLISEYVNSAGYSAGDYIGLKFNHGAAGTNNAIMFIGQAPMKDMFGGDEDKEDNGGDDGDGGPPTTVFSAMFAMIAPKLVIEYAPAEIIKEEYPASAAVDDTISMISNIETLNGYSGSFFGAGTVDEDIEEGLVEADSFVRFFMDVPPQAEITDAYIKFYSIDTNLMGMKEPDFNMQVKLLSSDGKWNKAGFGTDSYPTGSSLQSIPVGSMVAYNPAEEGAGNAYTKTEKITALVQEFVNSPSYRAGSYIGFKFDHNDADVNEVLLGMGSMLIPDMPSMFKPMFAQLMEGITAKLVVNYKRGVKSKAVYKIQRQEDDTIVSAFLNTNDMNGAIGGFGNETKFDGMGKIDSLLRFPVQIPKGATITDAYIKVYSQIIDDEGSELNPPIFSALIQRLIPDGKWNLHGFNLKNYPNGDSLKAIDAYPAGIEYLPMQEGWGDGYHRTPSISSLVQDFVDSPEYRVGNYLGIKIEPLNAEADEAAVMGNSGLLLSLFGDMLDFGDDDSGMMQLFFGNLTVNNSASLVVEFEDEDANSGCGYTYYRMDLDPTKDVNYMWWQPNIVDVVPLADGNFSILYYSKDNEGNEEEQKDLFILYDETPPDVNITEPAEDEMVFDFRNITISYQGFDETSGINNYWIKIAEDEDVIQFEGEVSFDSEGWKNNGSETSFITSSLADGNYFAYVKATDNADNNSSEATIAFSVSSDDPIIDTNHCVQDIGGVICEIGEVCLGEWNEADDTDRCCLGVCTLENDLTIEGEAESAYRRGDIVSVIARVYNFGGAVDETFSVGLKQGDELLGSAVLNGMDSADVQTVLFQFTYNTSNSIMVDWQGREIGFIVEVDPDNNVDEISELNNTDSLTIYFQGDEICGNYFDDDLDGWIDEGCIPDIYFENVSETGFEFEDGELRTADISFTLMARDFDVEQPFSLRYYLDFLEGKILKDERIDELRKDAPRDFNTTLRNSEGTQSRDIINEGSEDGLNNMETISTAPAEGYDQNLLVYADADEEILESNEYNNIIMFPLRDEVCYDRIDNDGDGLVDEDCEELCDNGLDDDFDGLIDEGCLLKPDLMIWNVTAPSNVITIEGFDINFTVKNQGIETAGSFWIDVMLDDNVLFFAQVSGLGSNEGVSFNEHIYNYSVGEHTLKIIVDVHNEVNESTESNNEFEKNVRIRRPYFIVNLNNNGKELIGDVREIKVLTYKLKPAVAASFALGLPSGNSRNLSLDSDGLTRFTIEEDGNYSAEVSKKLWETYLGFFEIPAIEIFVEDPVRVGELQTVRVETASGQPVPNATIIVLSPSGVREEYLTDSNGRMNFKVKEKGEYVVFVYRKDIDVGEVDFKATARASYGLGAVEEVLGVMFGESMLDAPILLLILIALSLIAAYLAYKKGRWFLSREYTGEAKSRKIELMSMAIGAAAFIIPVVLARFDAVLGIAVAVIEIIIILVIDHFMRSAYIDGPIKV